MKFFTTLILIFVFFPNISHAYIDPGTGSFIIQAILAVGASIVFYLGYPIRFFKKIFSKFKYKKDKEKKSS